MSGKHGVNCFRVVVIAMIVSATATSSNKLTPWPNVLLRHPINNPSQLIEFSSRRFADPEREKNMTRFKIQMEKEFGVTFERLDIDRDPDATDLHAILSSHLGPKLEKTPFFYNRQTGISTYGSPHYDNFKAWARNDPSYRPSRDYNVNTQQEFSFVDFLSPPLTDDEVLATGLNPDEEAAISRYAENPSALFITFANTTRALTEDFSWKGSYNWLFAGSITKLPPEERAIVQIREIPTLARRAAYSMASTYLPKYAQYVLRVRDWKEPERRNRWNIMKSAISVMLQSSTSLLPRVLRELDYSVIGGYHNSRGVPETLWKRIRRFPSGIITRKSL